MQTLNVTQIKKSKPYLVIAGPCSAESEEQVLETARALQKIPEVSIFRAGVWKPRTRPNSFEGFGISALHWLKTVKQETGLSVAIEVAKANHVYEALKFGIDVLWLGARTTANPFSVQEIADALAGSDVPVWVKNPVNPDLQLWIGAFERLHKAGVKKLGAIHRGFTSNQESTYRNSPQWGIPVELKRLVPGLPIICDPSHICGSTPLLGQVSQNALDLTMDGFMIETHPNPSEAMSDRKQQITPGALKELLANLKLRDPYSSDKPMEDELTKLRQSSNAVDYEILELLAKRMQIVKQIGQYKKENNMAILQVKRWKQVIEDRISKGTDLGLEKPFVHEIYEALHDYAIKLQSQIINEKTDSNGV